MPLRLVVLTASIAIAGCAAPLPTYPASTPDEAALAIIADRLEGTRTLVSEAETRLVAPDGRTIHLETAIAARFPDHLRLQAWKFSTLVLDLTIVPEGTYLYLAEETQVNGSLQAAAVDFGDGTRLMSGEFFRSARPLPNESTPSMLIAAGPGPRGEEIRCQIDRATLTPRQFRFPGAEVTLELNSYALVGAKPWAREIRLFSASGEVTVRLRNPELDTEVSDGAFTPPRRARRLP